MNFFDMVSNIKPAFTDTFDQTKVSGKPVYVSDVHVAAVIMMNRQKNQLLQKDPTGKIFCHVVSPTALTIIQNATMSDLGISGQIIQEHGLLILNGVQLIINPYWDDTQPIRTVHISSTGDIQTGELLLENISWF